MFNKEKDREQANILSFFADGPLWDNLIYLIGLPSGMSYTRPFRYREKWIEEGLYSELRTKRTRDKLIGKKVIISARFCSIEEYKTSILPIREGIIENIDFISDNISIYFKLGRFFSPIVGKSIIETCMKLNKVDSDISQEKLFFRCSPKSLPNKCGDQENEDEAWIEWSGKIANDGSLPFTNEARRSIFIRIQSLQTNRLVKIGKLYTSWKMGNIYGFCTKEGGRYELNYLHRIPFLFGKDESIPKFKIKADSSTTNWEFSNINEEISGNYQLHVLSMSAISSSASWERISLIPEQTKVTTKNMVEINILPFTFNIKASISFWHRFWSKYIWLIILGLSMVLKDIIVPSWKGEDIKPLVSASIIGVIIAIVGLIISQKNLVK